MGFLDKVKLAGQGAAQQTKVFAETTKINGYIADEEKQLNSIFNQIGKSYYENNKNNPNAEYRNLLINANDIQARIANYHDQIRKLKCAKTCPNCGAEVSSNAQFCNVCGAKLPTDPAPQPVANAPAFKCPQCGADVEVGSKFCGSCGYFMPDVQPVQNNIPTSAPTDSTNTPAPSPDSDDTTV